MNPPSRAPPRPPSRPPGSTPPVLPPTPTAPPSAPPPVPPKRQKSTVEIDPSPLPLPSPLPAPQHAPPPAFSRPYSIASERPSLAAASAPPADVKARAAELQYTLLSTKGVPLASLPRNSVASFQQSPAASLAVRDPVSNPSHSPLESPTSSSSSSSSSTSTTNINTTTHPFSSSTTTPSSTTPSSSSNIPFSSTSPRSSYPANPSLSSIHPALIHPLHPHFNPLIGELQPCAPSSSEHREYELHVHLIDCSTSMWKSNRWFGPRRIEETKRLLLNNINPLSSMEDAVVRFSCLLRFSGIPVKNVKEPATVLVPVMLHDVSQRERFISVARLHEPCSAEQDVALAPESGTRIISALLWVEKQVISPWLAAYGPCASGTRVFLEVYTDGKTGDPVLEMDDETLAKYRSVFEKEQESSPSLRSSILYAFGEDLDTAKKICYRTGVESLVMVPDVDTAIRERNEIVYRVRDRKAGRKNGGGGEEGGKRMIGFTYGDGRAEQLAVKLKGIRHLSYYILNRPQIMQEEGIFRIPGRSAVISAYVDAERNMFLASPSLQDLDEMEPHTVCGLFKAWLKIPPYILPGSTAQTITQILIRRQGFPALSAALEQFAQKEPAAHEILQLLLRLFYEVQLHSSSNQMRAEMIATVFAPSIVECPTIDDMSSSTSMLTQLISFSPLLFPAKPLESHPSE